MFALVLVWARNILWNLQEHTDGHTRGQRISVFTRQLTETILCKRTCDVSLSVLRAVIESPLDQSNVCHKPACLVDGLPWLLPSTDRMDRGQGPYTHSRPRPPCQGPRFVNQIGFPRAGPDGNPLFRRRTKLIRNYPLAWKKGPAGYRRTTRTVKVRLNKRARRPGTGNGHWDSVGKRGKKVPSPCSTACPDHVTCGSTAGGTRAVI